MTRALTILRWFGLGLAAALVAANLFIWFGSGPPRAIESGTPKVGAPFTLLDSQGRPVSDTDLRGKTVVLVFGATRDEDVTPALLQLLLAALDRTRPKNDAIQPVFVSVDPERDGASELKAFSERYAGRILVLGGSERQISELTQAFRLPVTRIPDAVLPGGYRLDFPAVYYVLGKDGRFRSAVPYTTDVTSLTDVLQNLAD